MALQVDTILALLKMAYGVQMKFLFHTSVQSFTILTKCSRSDIIVSENIAYSGKAVNLSPQKWGICMTITELILLLGLIVSIIEVVNKKK